MKLIFAMALLALAVIGGSLSQLISKTNLPLSSSQSDSPRGIMKAYYEALRMRDIEAMKKNLSKGTLELLEGYAKAQNKTLDESIKDGLSNDTNLYETPEIRNEKIDGDKATIEVKEDKTDKWETVPFVREDGAWKIALDQMFRDAMKSGNNNP